MSGSPKSDAERAALAQRLVELRARQATAAGGGINAGAATITTNTVRAPSANANHSISMNAATAPQGTQTMRLSYGYEDAYEDGEDEDEEEEEPFDLARHQFEEEFLRMLALQQQQASSSSRPSTTGTASIAHISSTRYADDGVRVVATDKTAQRTRELGDFEALRLAKMGDAASMVDFGTASGVDWKTFVDNQGRNALHYAADAGSAALITRVVEELRVPYVADERHLTPLDIAVLNGHVDPESDEVVAALILAATASRHSDAKMASGEVVKTMESVLQAHAPAPPKFVMSKPVPRPSEAIKPRTFWSASAPPAAAPQNAVQCSDGAALAESGDTATTEAVRAAVNALDRHGRLDWLLPVSTVVDAAAMVAPWQLLLNPSNSAMSTSDSVSPSCGSSGVVVGRVLSGVTLTGAAAQKLAKAGAGSTITVAAAAHLSVDASRRHNDVAAHLLQSLRAQLLETAPNAVVFFVSGTQLARPPTPLATVKWYRRVFDPVAVHASESAYDIFPDFYEYDGVLRADAVLKGALPASLTAQYASEIQSWCTVESSSEEQCALILDFVKATAGTAASGTELACVPQTVEALRRDLLAHPDHRTYARTDAAGALCDLVVLRCRSPRKGHTAESESSVFAVELAYAIFTSITGTAKADHMMLLATQLLGTKMLLVPTLYSLTDSDLAKANFEEMLSSREYVYAVGATSLTDVTELGSVAASKLSLPLFSL